MSDIIEIGDINSAPREYILKVYHGNTQIVKALVVMPDKTVIHNELMSEHFLKFEFNHVKSLKFERSDYVLFQNIKYALRENCQPEEASIQEYRYTLKFEAPEMFFQDFPLIYKMQGPDEVEWELNGRPEQFMQIAVDCINEYFGTDEYTVGIVEPTELIQATFNGTNVFDALTTDIAEKSNAEWYLDYEKKTLNLVTHYEHGDYITLQREISLKDIKRTNKNADEYCNRLIALGSTRNIPRNYRGITTGETIDAIAPKRLRLPIETGGYIDAEPGLKGNQVITKVKIFEHIYPKRIGEVTEVRKEEKKDNEGNPYHIYYIKDDELDFKSEYILPGETLMLRFETNSRLSGYDFELGYNDKTKEFEIIMLEVGEYILPNETMSPRVGDNYTLYNFDIAMVGDLYVPEGEKELEREAKEYMKYLQEENATYTCPVIASYRYERNLDMEIGQRVRLRSVLFADREKKSRVFGYDKYPVTFEDEYIIGDKPEYKRLRGIEDNVAENKKIADMQYLELMKRSNNTIKSLEGLGYLKTALQNETMIDKGLLLTTLIRLGAAVGTEWKEVAGINGAAINPDDVVAYFGGSLDDAILGIASIIFKMDGSGHLAKGNISWDALGDLLMHGRFTSTDEDGNTIIVDAKDKAFKMINRDDEELLTISFDSSGVRRSARIDFRTENYVSGEISTMNIDSSHIRVANVKGSTMLDASGLILRNADGSVAKTFTR